MREDELKSVLQALDQEFVSDSGHNSAKEQTLQAAMTEFRSANELSGQQAAKSEPQKHTFFQGFLNRLRPSVGNQPNKRNELMKTTNRFQQHKWQYTGFATASVLAVAIMIAYQHPEQALNKSPASSDRPAVYDSSNSITFEDRRARQDIDELIARENKASALKAQSDSRVASRKPIKPEASVESGRNGKRLSEEMFFSSQPASAVATIQPRMAAKQAHPLSADIAVQPGYKEVGRDQFEHVDQNPVKKVSDQPVSTFSIDVDTASYSFIRRQLNQGVLPQKDAVRTEEMLNYFDYDYPQPESSKVPFSTSVNVIDSPWKTGNKLIHIGIKGYQLPAGTMPRSNLVFLLDVSGSMNSPDKLPLVKQSMSLLLSQLQPEDTVAIAVYAGASGTVLEPTPVSQKSKIMDALNRLQAGGSTAGGEGLKLAYQLAEASFDEKAVNRIILATDGDFNVGITDREELKGFVERKRDKGIYLSVLGFGQGNYHDQLMQTLAQHGNGVAAYIDTLSEAQKVLVHQATSTLFTIAKDVKIQVEFNPETVSEYRLLGYETRHLANQDFNNDKVDAGDIGAGHTVTAIYEITPVGADSGLLPDSRYQKTDLIARMDAQPNEYGFLKLRYKLPDQKESKLISQPIVIPLPETAPNNVLARETRFATAVAGFAELLKGSKYSGNWRYDDALEMAQQNKGADLYGYRTELVQLIRKAKTASEM